MSKLYSFQFLDKRPEDLNPMLLVDSRDIGYPSRTVVTATVPFSSQQYDFSEPNGEPSFGNRTIKYVINVLNLQALNPATMHELTSQLVNWLEDSHGRQPLRDDAVPGYHFLGEVRDAPSLSDSVETGTLTVTFDCYAYMIRDIPEGINLWCGFHFHSDTFQQTAYDIDGDTHVLLINNGMATAQPTITSDAPMTITVGSRTYQVDEGVSSGFRLPVGTNFIEITGTGHVSFEWYKEVL